MVGIYWNNHHHMFHAVHHVSGAMLWANLHLLFWLSLVPFVTGWMDENHFAPLTVAAYGAVLLDARRSRTTILTRVLLRLHGHDSRPRRGARARLQGLDLARDLHRRDRARVRSIRSPRARLYAVVAVIWLCPDQRFEKLIAAQH